MCDDANRNCTHMQIITDIVCSLYTYSALQHGTLTRCFFINLDCYIIKRSLTRDFRLQVFFVNQCPSVLWVFHWGCFKLFWNCSVYQQHRRLILVSDRRCRWYFNVYLALLYHAGSTHFCLSKFIEDQAFSPSYDLALPRPIPPLQSASSFSFLVFLCVAGRLLIWEGGGEEKESNIRRRESLVLYNTFNTIWSTCTMIFPQWFLKI